jgi:thioredoxin reductase (NADPH)
MSEPRAHSRATASPDDPRNQIAFPRLTNDQLASLAEYAARRDFHEGEPLFEAGGNRNAFFVVVSGAVEIIDRSADADKPRSIVVHKPGEFTGDVDLLTRRRPLVSAVARGDTRVLEIAPADIRRIIAERPAVGELILRAFIARREMLLDSGFTGVRVIGSGRSRDAYQLREFLSRNQVPVTWIDTDDDPGVGELLDQFGLGEGDLPAVICDGRPLMRNPTVRQLAEAVGLKPTLGTGVYDLVIIGAGPAGLAAAVYGASEGLRTLILDRNSPGGQAGASMKIENYLGFPTGITGAQLTARATLQAQKFDARFSIPSPVSTFERDGENIAIGIEGGERAVTRCALIATGAEYRRLDVPGRERFEGLGVYYEATFTELGDCKDVDVVLVGGGNSAGQAAVFLSEHLPHVILIVRGGDLRADMSSYLVERIEDCDNIEVLGHTQIREMQGSDRLERVVVENARTGATRTIDTPAVFTFIGAVPRTEWLPLEIETDDAGYIRTGRAAAHSPNWSRPRPPFLLETSWPGVFAAGDVRLGSVKRVASAVGEGSMAVKFVHEYLADATRDTV